MHRTLSGLAIAAVGIAVIVGSRLVGQLVTPPRDILATGIALLPAVPAADALQKDTTALADMQKQKNAMHLKKQELAARCDDDLRRANRDGKTAVLLRCFRGDLTTELQTLRAIKQDLRAAISTPATQELTTSTDALTEAIAAIVSGIDNDVFTTEADAEESKRNLGNRYRTPVWIAQTHVDAERLQWRLRAAMDELAAMDDQALGSYADAISCLETARISLDRAGTGDDLPSAQSNLAAAHTQLTACLPLLAPAADTGSGAQTPEA